VGKVVETVGPIWTKYEVKCKVQGCIFHNVGSFYNNLRFCRDLANVHVESYPGHVMYIIDREVEK
jgi:hypothetical protein